LEDLSEIPQYSAWREITPVEKGWSSDKKYRIVDMEGRAFLLRTSAFEESQRKAEEFRMMIEFAKTNVNMSMPIEHGLFDHNHRVFTLLTWVEGTEAEEHLKRVSKAEQYKLGYSAGKVLRRLHTLPAPGNIKDWETRYNKKIDSKISKYSDCPVKVRSEDRFLEFISENRSLLKNREQTYHHGDFHVGNLIVTSQFDIGVIDFNRADFGDPWEEFNRIIFCSGVSPSFATGRIDGYFDSEVPEDFFRLLALYISVNSISAVPWAIPFGEKEVDTMLKQAESILGFYDNFSTTMPSWYENNKEQKTG